MKFLFLYRTMSSYVERRKKKKKLSKGTRKCICLTLKFNIHKYMKNISWNFIFILGFLSFYKWMKTFLKFAFDGWVADKVEGISGVVDRFAFFLALH